MRGALILGLLVALGCAGTAYAAVTVTNVDTLHAKITPTKSGTKTHPRSSGGHFDRTVTTNPKGYRPNIVKTVDVTIQGVRENTNQFPVCGSARLNDPSEGPATCPPSSRIGKGFLIAEITTPGTQSGKPVLTCRAETTIYNGGNHTLTYSIYRGTPMAGQPQPCPLTRNEGVVAILDADLEGA